MTETEYKGFLFAELASLTPGKPFAGFAAGDFVDMFGREVKLKANDIKDFVANTLALIADFQGKGMPGLPIDGELHNKGKAAGWIVGAEPGEVNDSSGKAIPVIRLAAEWTKLGVELIQDKIMANFSPSVNLTKKVIIGGSLTNWAATQDDKGVPLFSAIELSQGIYKLSNVETVATEPADTISPNRGNGDVTMSDEKEKVELTQPAPEVTPEAPAQNAQGGADAAELMDALFKHVPNIGSARPGDLAELVQNLAVQMATKQVEGLLAEQQQQWEITELAAKLTGGGLRGLPITIPELTDFFLSLEPPQFEKAKSIFTKITSNGLVEFQEFGHGRLLRGKRQLPEVYHKSLKEVLAAGQTVTAFFEAQALGDPSDYDLSQFGGHK